MIYSINSDVDLREVNAELLQQEILTAGATSCGILIQNDSLNINAPGITDEALALIVKNHDSFPLPSKKKSRVLEIDTRTREIIDGGFTFDGHQFSLSQNAQMNWLGMAVLQGALSWPVGITDQTDHTYSLALADLPTFVGIGMTVIKSSVDSGRTLKEAALSAANKSALDAVVDAR